MTTAPRPFGGAAFFAILLLLIASSGSGQKTAPETPETPETPGTPETQRAPDDAPRPPATAPPPKVTVSISPTGVHRYDRGEWAVVAVRGANATDRDAHAEVSVFFENHRQRIFTRSFWIPARSRRVTWLPVRVPLEAPGRQDFIRVYNTAVITTDAGSSRERGPDQLYETETYLPLNQTPTQLGAIFHQGLLDAPRATADRNRDAYDLLTLARESSTSDYKLITFDDAFFPPYPSAFDGLDQLALCSDRWLDDSAAPETLRSWLAQGGAIWVMLDSATHRTTAALLGSGEVCEVVDRVALSEFTLETPSLSLRSQDSFERWASERPVDFVRVVVSSDAEVHCRIDGWPAAFSVRMGRGEVLFTTLAPRGWHHQRGPLEDPPPEGIPASGTTRALRRLTELVATSTAEPLPAAELKPILQSQIGYEVLPRSVAALILGGNAAALLAVGWILARRRKLERLVWAAPLIFVATAGSLVWIGARNTAATPSTAASFELLEVDSRSQHAHSNAIVSFYSSAVASLPLNTSRVASASPHLDSLAGSIQREIWSDAQRGRWEKLPVAPGAARLVEARNNAVLPGPVRARGRFGPAGFAGQLVGADVIDSPADAVIALRPAAASNIQFDRDYQFVCKPDTSLAPGEYLTGAVLSDEQQRRQQIYRTILTPANSDPYPAQPTLFAWSGRRPLEIDTPETFRQVGATLWALPLEIEQTPRASSFVVPEVFVPALSALGGHSASKFYNPRTGAWMQGATAATQSMFRFGVPPQVLPCQLRKAVVTLKIHAPSRRVSLLGRRGESAEIVPLKTWESPSGVLQWVVDDPALLHIDRHQGVLLGFTVSLTQRQRDAKRIEKPGGRGAGARPSPDRGDFDNSTWQASWIRVSFAGETL